MVVDKNKTNLVELVASLVPAETEVGTVAKAEQYFHLFLHEVRPRKRSIIPAGTVQLYRQVSGLLAR